MVTGPLVGHQRRHCGPAGTARPAGPHLYPHPPARGGKGRDKTKNKSSKDQRTKNRTRSTKHRIGEAKQHQQQHQASDPTPPVRPGPRRPSTGTRQPAGDRPGPTDQGGSPSGRPARDRSRNAPASVFGFPGFGTLRSHSTTDRKNSSPAHAKGRLLDGSIRERSPGRAQLPTLLDRDGRKCDAEQLAHEYAEIETAR